MKRITFFALAAATMVGSAQAVVITQWNFNSVPPDALTTTGSLTPSIGVGTASVVGGGVSSAFASGSVDGGSSDPTATDDTGWQTANYASTLPNKTGGIQGLSSTVGYEDIFVSFDVRKSNTATRFLQVQYTTDGSLWTDFGAALEQSTGSFWFNSNIFDLSAISAVENNANFGVRVVAAFGPAGSYVATNTGSSFGAAGTVRYDMLTISGTELPPVPEPASMAVLGIGAMALISRRRNRK